MGDGYTELFFLDAATALAAGHRPCFECRRADARTFADAWARAFDLPRPPRAAEMDAILHAERLRTRDRIRSGDLPDGAMAQTRDGPALFRDGALHPWRFDGYGAPRPAEPDVEVAALTPACVRAVLAAGYRPMIHPSAGA